MAAPIRTQLAPSKAVPLQAVLDKLKEVDRATAAHAITYKQVRPKPTLKLKRPGRNKAVGEAFTLLKRILSNLLTVDGTPTAPADLDEMLKQMVRNAGTKPEATPTRVEPTSNTIAETFNRLMKSGELLDSATFLARVGFRRQALSKAVAAHRIFYLESGGVRGYPAFYLDPQLDRAKVEAVSKILGGLSGGSKWMFFTTPKGSLAKPGKMVKGVLTQDGTPRTPLQAMKDGEHQKVQQAAHGFAGR